MLKDIFFFVGMLVFIGFFVIIAAFSEGWSPVQAIYQHRSNKVEITRKKRLAELEIKKKELEVQLLQEELVEKQWRRAIES